MGAIDVMRDALFGNPPSPTKEPSREGVLAAFTQLYDAAVVAQAAAQAGITILPTTSARDTFYATEANRAKLVYVNNQNGSATDPANGVYEYVGGAARLAQSFYAGVATVVQPLVDDAEDAADRAEAASGSAIVARDQTIAALQPLSASLKSVAVQTSSRVRVPTGWDAGLPITVRYYMVDGRGYVMAKRDASFKAAWRIPGGGPVIIDTATGDRWEAIVVSRLKDPRATGTAGTYVAVSWSAGNDGNAGTDASPKKSVNAALALSGNVDIAIKSRVVGSASYTFGQREIARTVSFRGAHPAGGPTYFSSIRDDDNLVFTSLGDGVYKTVTNININVKTTATLFFIGNGLIEPVPYLYEATTYADDAARKAALLAKAPRMGEGAWLVDATPADPGQGWYIKTSDGNPPTFGSEGTHIYSEAGSYMFLEPTASGLAWVEGLRFHANGKTADTPAFMGRTRGVTQITSGAGVAYQGQVHGYDVGFYGSGKQGLKIQDLATSFFSKVRGAFNREDAINPHSLNGELTTLRGSYMRLFFQDVDAGFSGEMGFREQGELSGSANAYTSHDAIPSTVVNIVGYDTYGSPCAVVSASKTWIINGHFSNPTQPAGLGPTPAQPVTSDPGSPRAPYWADGADTKLWLSFCSGVGDSGGPTFVVSNGATIYLDRWVGPAWTAQCIAGGTVRDFDGNVLAS